MAEKLFTNVRLGLKIDTLENWGKSTLILKKGEVAFATVAASAGTGLTEPVVMMKIGDGEKTFSQLDWNFYAKAADVLAACKTEEGLKTFINNVIADAGIATDEALTALAGRVTTAEGEIDALQAELDTAETGLKARMTTAEGDINALETLVGDTAVATQIANAIAELKLGETYAAKSLETTVDNHIKDTVAHVTADDKVKWNNALQSTDVATGSANGTISVKGNDVAVKGLGSAAYTDASAYDASGSAAAAQAAAEKTAKEYTDAREVEIKKYADQAETDAVASAKSYTDEREAAIKAAYEAYADQAEADALKDAKDYVDEVTGGKSVSDSIADVIKNYSTTEQMNSAIATAKGEAVSHADGLNTAMNTRVEALEAIDHSHTFVESELNLIQSGDVAKWNAAEQNAKDYADGLDEVMDGRVAALEAKFTGEDSVADQIADAVAVETEAREEAIAGLQAQIGEASAEGKEATGLVARIEELEGLVGDEKVSEAIAAEAKAREDADKALGDRVKAIEDDYLTSADKTELTDAIATAKQEAIATILGEGVDADFDTLKEVADWILSDTTGAAALQKDVADIKADYLKAADKTELEGKITAAQNAADKAQGEVDALEEVVATKAAQSDLEALAGRVSTVESDLNTETTGLKARMTTAEADIDTLEAKVGDKTVSEQIAAVTNPLDARIVELEKVDHSHENATVLDGISAEKVAAWDAKVDDVTAAADSGLKATRTGNTVAIEIDDSVTFIFDCGGSGVVAE